MTQKSRNEMLRILRQEYATASYKRKKEMLNTVVSATGYNRKYAIQLLRCKPQNKPRKQRPPTKYGPDVVSALVSLWEASNYLCGKRLVAFIPAALPAMEAKGHLQLDDACRAKLLEISAASIDRILKKEKTYNARTAVLSKHGAVLRKHVEVKTFADWDHSKPGFLEVDTVAHAGGINSADHLWTLTMTDVATGWTELIALPDKTERSAIQGLEQAIKRFPFQIFGIDTDNGTEFLNYALIQWCERRSITFTRSRPYKKNDQCFVEEKNGSVVRKLAGHKHYAGLAAFDSLSNLYWLSHSYVNFFQPSTKLLSKTRIGAKVHRQYDTPKTPYQRVLEMELPSTKALRDQLEMLDPVRLLQDIRKLQMRLLNLESASEVVEHLPTPKRGLFKSARRGSGIGLTSQIARRLFSLEHGEILSIQDFKHHQNDEAVRSILQRFVDRGLITRVARGRWSRIDDSVTPDELVLLRSDIAEISQTVR